MGMAGMALGGLPRQLMPRANPARNLGKVAQNPNKSSTLTKNTLSPRKIG